MSLHVEVRATLMAPPDLQAAIERGMIRSVLLVKQRAADSMSGTLVRARTGRLAQSLTVKVARRVGYIIGVVGVLARTGFYALFLEYGARPHSLTKGARSARGPSVYLRRGRERLRRGQRARAGRPTTMLIPGVGFRTTAKSPGIAPRHVLARAAEGAKAQIRALFTAEAARAIQEGAARGRVSA